MMSTLAVISAESNVSSALLSVEAAARLERRGLCFLDRALHQVPTATAARAMPTRPFWKSRRETLPFRNSRMRTSFLPIVYGLHPIVGAISVIWIADNRTVA
ncbi:MAG: hypothetical protein GDA49_07035 [Rhodospirillales bacterium]|nr:hypothetical protein [Rhodospirillales bacterium]